MPRINDRTLSRTEEMLLLAVLRLGDNAYGAAIRAQISKLTHRTVSAGAVYIPLDRLTGRNLLTTFTGEPTPERGGRSKRYYRLTAVGLEALRETRKMNETMWSGISDLPDSSAI
ncbi:MAG: PadR family transcriptional regulator [Candidatus Latescibacteria bacterium]|jgi:PadR family transcriptional regulator, regulatory protein PadR|nr:PadR family transcriptional regulator [Candidatus Latescibacterota bacterium]